MDIDVSRFRSLQCARSEQKVQELDELVRELEDTQRVLIRERDDAQRQRNLLEEVKKFFTINTFEYVCSKKKTVFLEK